MKTKEILFWDHDPATHKIERAQGARNARQLQKRASKYGWAFKFIPAGNGLRGMYARLDGVALRPKSAQEHADESLNRKRRIEQAHQRKALPLKIRIVLRHSRVFTHGLARCCLWEKYRQAEYLGLAEKVLPGLAYKEPTFDGRGLSAHGPRTTSILAKLGFKKDARDNALKLYGLL